MLARVLCVFLMILGAGSFAYGSYMERGLVEGEVRVDQAEANQQSHRRPTLGPVRRGIKTEASENAQQKIGNEKILLAKSQISASWLKSAGAALFAIGLVCLVLHFCLRRKR